jgi:hypothetical protein
MIRSLLDLRQRSVLFRMNVTVFVGFVVSWSHLPDASVVAKNLDKPSGLEYRAVVLILDSITCALHNLALSLAHNFIGLNLVRMN